MAADAVTVGGPTNQRQREHGAGRRTTTESGSAAAETKLTTDTTQRAPSSNPGDNMTTKETAENQSDVDIQQLLQKYGQVQNQFPLTDDTKKRYNKEGFRIRFRLSRAYRGLEKQEILASRPDFSNMNGPRRKKQIQKLMQQLEENLMLFDPDESARRKAQERELERQKLLKECRENAKKKWKNDGDGARSVQGNVGKSSEETKTPSRASQHMAEYWGKPAKKKGKEPKGDWRVKQKDGEKPWWHKFVKRKKQKNGLAENGANEGKEANGYSKQVDGAKPAEPGEADKAGDRDGKASDAEKFFITNPGSQSDSYSAVEEWQRRNAERKGRKAERIHKLKMASRSNKDKSVPTKGKQDGQNGKTTPTDQKVKDSKNLTQSKTDKSADNKPGLVEEIKITPPSVSQNDPSAGNTDNKNEADKENTDLKTVEEIPEVMEQPSYSFMAFGGFNGCKSEASSMTSASSARSEAEFDDDADKSKLDLLLRVQSNIASGSRDGSRAGSSPSKHRHETEARTTAPVRSAHRQIKQPIHKPTQSRPKSVSFKADRHDAESVEHHPRIELHDPDGQEVVLEGAAAAAAPLPGQVTGAKVKDTTTPSRKAAPGILKDASSTAGHKLHRTRSAPTTHGHRPKTASAAQKDDGSTGQEAAKDEDKPLKICRYMYTMCNCQRVGRPSTLAKLRQKRKKVVGVITVYGCPDEEERKRSTSPTVCPFCSVFPRYRINAWLKDVPVVAVD